MSRTTMKVQEKNKILVDFLNKMYYIVNDYRLRRFIMKKKYFLVFVLFIALISVMFIGCSKSDNDGKIVIKYMRWANPAEVKSTKELLDLFMKQNPDIKVVLGNESWSAYWDKLQTLFASGDGPDVFLLGSYYIVDFYKKGILENLQPYIEKSKNINLKKFFKPPVELYKFNGDLYALPRDINSIVLYYNKDLFDRAGVKYPTASWTWDDIIKAGKQLTRDYNNDGIIDQYGILIPSSAYVYETGWGNLILQAGGSLLNKEKTKATVNTPAVAKALQFLWDLEYKYKIAPMEKSKASLGDNVFMTGKVAMVYDGSWMIGTYKTIKSFKWDVQLLPKGKRRACIANGVANAMSSKSKHKEAAWKLIEFLSSKEAQIAVAKSGTAIPVLKDIAYSKYYLDGVPENKKACLEMIKYGHNYPVTSQMNRWLDKAIGTELDLIMLNKKSIKEGLADAEKAVNAILSED